MADRPPTSAGPMTWVLRAVLALAALAAPIITFKAFTDADTPDPVRQQRLREAHDGSETGPARSRATTTDPHSGPRP
ncbi:MAG TPA: hypothetical protein VKD90_21470 [Gemmataceae bacterium]|nr:hypothetical protein [Gemmataceae bacterium]